MAAKRYTPDQAGSAASKFGQMIGETFEQVAIAFIGDYVQQAHPGYDLLKPARGRKKVTLEMAGGLLRQMDVVVHPQNSNDPVALLETKWLKDARHHNDKGAWILQLREVRKKYATIRGVAAILAGYWTEGVGVMLMGEGGIEMVLVATDEEIYCTLQGPLDEYLKQDTFALDVSTMQQSYPRAWDLANLLLELQERNKLQILAASWLHFIRETNDIGEQTTGADLIRQAVDKLLAPLPEYPRVERLEIVLEINTGNLIRQQFDDLEAALEFIQTHFHNPQEILNRIRPKQEPSD
jgi:hypothetical protein